MSLSDNKRGLAWGAGLVVSIAAVVQAWSYLATVFEQKGWPPISEFAVLKTEVRCLKLDRRLPGLRRWVDRAEPDTENWQNATDTLQGAEEDWDKFDCAKALIQ